LVFGADGFIGRTVVSAMSENHDVHGSSRDGSDNQKIIQLDLRDKQAISQVLDSVRPEVIINCAGVVENSDKAKLNIEFTKNILEAAAESRLEFKRIIICGSASEYGIVNPDDIPVKESIAINPDTVYGQSKADEEKLAL